HMNIDAPRMHELRDHFERSLLDRLPGVQVNGDPDSRSCHVTNLSFENVPGDVLISSLEDLCVSSGSACTRPCLEPSYVLSACGVSRDLAYSSLRFSLGRPTTKDEIEYAIDKTVECITNLRALAAMTNGAMNLAK